MNNGQRDVVKLLQQTLRGGVVHTPFGVVFDQASQLFLVLLQLSTGHELDQGQQPHSDAQQVRQTRHLVIPFDEQWVQRERHTFQAMKVTLKRPFTPISQYRRRQSQLLDQGIRAIGASGCSQPPE